MKKVLIITYYWPPSGGSGVQRWLKFAKYLPQFGWEPIIYTPANPDVNSTDATLLKDVSPSLTVIKRKITEPYKFYKILLGKKKGDKIDANIVGNNTAPEKGLKGLINSVSMHIRANWFIPDPRVWWVSPSVKFLTDYLRSAKADAIVSTGPPHSMHLIAKKLHERTGVPWLADFRDPWTKIFWFKHLRLTKRSFAKHKQLEKEVVGQADKIVVVTKGMQEDFLHTASNVEVITNGYDPEDFSTKAHPELERAIEQIDSQTKGLFVIAHTGLMTENANPDNFWKALGELAGSDKELKKRLLIVTMGQTDSCIKTQIAGAGLQDNYRDFGYVPHLQAIAWQKRANLLLMPLRKEKEAAAILTGKYFEYLASGNPILAIGTTTGDLAASIAETHSGSIYEYSDKEGIAKGIADLWNDFLNNENQNAAGYIKLKNTYMAKNINRERFSRVALAEEMARLLDNISAHNRGNTQRANK